MSAFFDLGHFVRRLMRKPARVVHRRPAHPYHSVTIRAPASACDAAKALADRQFLSTEAPHLPLAECNAKSCTCTFGHHDDRRHEPRRAADLDIPPQHYDGANARTGRGRRRSDEVTYDDRYFDYAGNRRNGNGDGEQSKS